MPILLKIQLLQYLNHGYWNKHIYSTQKGFEECVRDETAHLATLKYILEIKNTKGRKVQPWDQANGRQKLGLVWRNRKKISQIINTYLTLPLFYE
jgi:hypothetical protein